MVGRFRSIMIIDERFFCLTFMPEDDKKNEKPCRKNINIMQNWDVGRCRCPVDKLGRQALWDMQVCDVY